MLTTISFRNPQPSTFLSRTCKTLKRVASSSRLSISRNPPQPRNQSRRLQLSRRISYPILRNSSSGIDTDCESWKSWGIRDVDSNESEAGEGLRESEEWMEDAREWMKGFSPEGDEFEDLLSSRFSFSTLTHEESSTTGEAGKTDLLTQRSNLKRAPNTRTSSSDSTQQVGKLPPKAIARPSTPTQQRLPTYSTSYATPAPTYISTFPPLPPTPTTPSPAYSPPPTSSLFSEAPSRSNPLLDPPETPRTLRHMRSKLFSAILSPSPPAPAASLAFSLSSSSDTETETEEASSTTSRNSSTSSFQSAGDWWSSSCSHENENEEENDTAATSLFGLMIVDEANREKTEGDIIFAEGEWTGEGLGALDEDVFGGRRRGWSLLAGERRSV
ncbi:hypothetical protein P7C70_g3253, partial [Phenoliferia sp. Uapishka_3]